MFGSAFGQRFRQCADAAQQRRAQRAATRQRNGSNAAAQAAPNALPPGAILNNLPPEGHRAASGYASGRQEQFLQNNQRFQNLPPEQQAQIRQRLEAWNRLTPAQQQDLRERQQVWEQMTPEQQRDVRQTLLPRWQQLPPPRRQAILQRLHSLRDLSEAERQAKLNDPAFVQGLNPEDREMLGQLAHLHVGMAPDPPWNVGTAAPFLQEYKSRKETGFTLKARRFSPPPVTLTKQFCKNHSREMRF